MERAQQHWGVVKGTVLALARYGFGVRRGGRELPSVVTWRGHVASELVGKKGGKAAFKRLPSVVTWAQTLCPVSLLLPTRVCTRCFSRCFVQSLCVSLGVPLRVPWQCLAVPLGGVSWQPCRVSWHRLCVSWPCLLAVPWRICWPCFLAVSLHVCWLLAVPLRASWQCACMSLGHVSWQCLCVPLGRASWQCLAMCLRADFPVTYARSTSWCVTLNSSPQQSRGWR